MNYIIKNEYYTLIASDKGAEIVSLKNDLGTELMWQTDSEELWDDHAPLLFPVCGQLKDKGYSYNGVRYDMSSHGFAKYSDFILTTLDSAKILFELRSSEKTRKIYPFDFVLYASYELRGKDVIFSVTVTVVALNSVGALGDLFLSLFGEPPTASDAITENNAVFVLIKSVIFASFFEEMLFRGAVLHALSDRKPAIRILISATFFALMHCNVLQFFYAFTTGAIISFFAVMHNSLALAAVIHLCANLVTFILSLLRGTLSEGHFKTVSVLTFVTFTLLAVLFSVPYFLKICKKNTEQGETKADAVPKEMWIYVLVTAAFTAIGAFTG